MNEVKEPIEEVKTHCIHKDCIYRGQIDAGWTPVCLYAMYEGKARGCKISECDKYTPGKKIKAKLRDDIVIYWETELYGDTDADIMGRRPRGNE